MECGGLEALDSGGAALGARIMRGLHRSIGMEQHGAGVTHDVAMGLRQQLDIVSSSHQAVDEPFRETRFHVQPSVGFA
jgi:hypothetical protein